MTITLHNISEPLRQKLQERALLEKKSLDAVAIEMLEDVAGLKREPKRHNDLDWFFGSGALEPEVLKALDEMRVLNPEEWK